MSGRPHQGVSSQSTATKPRKRTARNVDPSMNSLWMLTMKATIAMRGEPDQEQVRPDQAVPVRQERQEDRQSGASPG